MLRSQLYTKCPCQDWQIAIPPRLVLLIILHFINGSHAAAQQRLNLSIPVTSPSLVYTPFVCNASTVIVDPQTCAGGWEISNSDNTVTSTGPSSASGNLIPQLFFEFQGSGLFLNTTSSSDALVNLSLSVGGTEISAIFNSSIGSVFLLNLPQYQTTLLTVTYIPTADATEFGLQSLIITVPTNKSLNSILPTPTLPPFASLPTFIPTASSSSEVATPTTMITVISDQKMIAQAVGITIGLGLGLTLLAITTFYYWKRRRQRLGDNAVDDAKPQLNGDG